jgi:hypothetical protein
MNSALRNSLIYTRPPDCSSDHLGALLRVLRCLRLAPGGQTGSAAIALCCGSRGLAGGKASRKLRDRPARKPLGIRSAVSASRAAASASLQRSSTGGADFG